jgi:hypothetical protein
MKLEIQSTLTHTHKQKQNRREREREYISGTGVGGAHAAGSVERGRYFGLQQSVRDRKRRSITARNESKGRERERERGVYAFRKKTLVERFRSGHYLRVQRRDRIGEFGGVAEVQSDRKGGLIVCDVPAKEEVTGIARG